MTVSAWLRYLFIPQYRPNKFMRIDRDVDEQRRMREVWLRLERVGREIQEIAERENQ